MTVLITGGAGMLGQAVAATLAGQNVEHAALDKDALDVTDPGATQNALRHYRPRLVIHCAAYTRVDDAEGEEAVAFDVNGGGTASVAAACRDVGARLIFPSTDYVFDGTARSPYPPDARPHPLNAYGRSKLAGEHAARAAGDVLIVRTAWLYGKGGRNFVRTVAERIAAGLPLNVVDDQRGSPSWTHDIANTLLALAHEAPGGIYHATNSGTATWYDFALEIAGQLGLESRIVRCTSNEFTSRARRPVYSVLDCRITDAHVGPARPWPIALTEAIASGSY
jgi:dTDP-4-dehydrorhamnose reductase